MKSLNELMHPNPHTDSPIEESLYQEFGKYGFKPETQYPISGFFVDLAFPEIKLAIEADGQEWHSSPEQVKRDKRRQQILEKLGWTVVRFTGKFIANFGEMAVARILLQFFQDRLSYEQEERAVGRVVAYFTNPKAKHKDIALAESIVESFRQKHPTPHNHTGRQVTKH